jgi:NAD+ synthase
MPFDLSALALDAPQETNRIVETLREQVLGRLKRRGVVVGLSGGIDSSVCVALAVRAFGPEKVTAIAMPERDSADESLALAELVAGALGVALTLERIAPGLEALGCYRRQLEAIREVFPDYGDGWRCKVVLPSVLESERMNVSRLVVESPLGERFESRMSSTAYLGLIAATNLKQRVRKLVEYTHADRLNFAVIGTPNRLEYDQGFFVKQGDGAADVKPIAHLYKTQVYALAEYLGVPEDVRRRPPTTDTFSLPQGQDEFYFALPYGAMDACLFALNHGVPAAELAGALGYTEDQIARVFRDIERKRVATRYLHEPPLLVDAVRDAQPSKVSR